jgi:1,2-phenylacetyl-CoA epoxidase catalytic subunit
MNTRTAQLPKPYHDAVIRWRDTYLPDYGYLMDHWERSFPTDPRFELCAYREDGMCSEVEVGVNKGKPKAVCASELAPEQAGHLLAAIRAQASTEFGSIQQHRTTLARAQDAEEQIWILRMMAEELRHGYQMLHLLMEDDWSCVTQDSGADMVEEILSMTTGSHLLGAFNIEFDSFVDSAVFCALIDRVGKYQLEMQKISAYKPMAESMPQMLREEAFHLAAGVVPMRRWMQQAARGEVYVTVEALQRTINKWLPRGMEMFGDERGGGTNVRFGLKPMKNAEAQQLYYEELEKVIHDLNSRFVRARLPELDRTEAKELLERILADRTTEKGIAYEDLLHAPDPGFFRRRGVPAFERIGVDGERYDDVESYLRHLRQQLPESYLAGSDFSDYVDRLRQVEAGEMTRDDAAKQMPSLRRVGGTCICSKSVRWVVEEQLPPVGVTAAAAS